MKKFLSIVVSIIIIGGLTVFLLPGYIDKTQSKNAAEDVLENVIKQNYDKAFKSVYYYDRASDLEPIISYKDAKEKWIQRVKALEEKGIYLVDYKHLRVNLEDTYPVGSVDLIFMESGKKKRKDNVQLWFASNGEEWKLGNLDFQYDEIEEEWEYVLSGIFN